MITSNFESTRIRGITILFYTRFDLFMNKTESEIAHSLALATGLKFTF